MRLCEFMPLFSFYHSRFDCNAKHWCSKLRRYSDLACFCTWTHWALTAGYYQMLRQQSQWHVCLSIVKIEMSRQLIFSSNITARVFAHVEIRVTGVRVRRRLCCDGAMFSCRGPRQAQLQVHYGSNEMGWVLLNLWDRKCPKSGFFVWIIGKRLE